MLFCLPKGIRVRVPRAALRDLGTVHLNDPQCGTEEESDTHVVLVTPLDGCGTVRRSRAGKTHFSNRVVAPSPIDKDDARESSLDFPFMCAIKAVDLPLGGAADQKDAAE